MEKIGRNLVCNSFYIESEVVANISDSNTTNRLKKKVRDYRTGLYCVTKCCKARNYRLF